MHSERSFVRSSRKKRRLWTCARCGHRFVTRNMWHSCRRYRLADHFKSKDPIVRDLFRGFRALVRKCGPVTVYAQKTRIVFQTRARFTGVAIRKTRLDGAVWFKRKVEHPRFYRIEFIPPGDYIHTFGLRSCLISTAYWPDLCVRRTPLVPWNMWEREAKRAYMLSVVAETYETHPGIA